MPQRALAGLRSDAQEAARDRRDGQRATLEWKGRFRVLDPSAPPPGWVHCYLLDISSDGCAMEVHGAPPALGQVVLVRLDGDSRHSAEGLQLRATVVNHRRKDSDQVYGLLFRGLISLQYEALLHITMEAKTRPPRH